MMVEKNSLLVIQKKPEQLRQVHVHGDKAANVQKTIEVLNRLPLQSDFAIISLTVETVDVEEAPEEGRLPLLHSPSLVNNFLNIVIV